MTTPNENQTLENSTDTRTFLRWQLAHWAVGTSTLVLFPLAGIYMRYVARVPQLADAPRLVFRSRFLFLLLLALANLALCKVQPRDFAQRLASLIILLAPAPMIAAFFVEPSRGVQSSLLTVTTMRGLFVAGLLLVYAQRPRFRDGP
jgi:hypothetical protein